MSPGCTKNVMKRWNDRKPDFRFWVRCSRMASFSPQAGRRSRQGDEGLAPSFQTRNPASKQKAVPEGTAPCFRIRTRSWPVCGGRPSALHALQRGDCSPRRQSIETTLERKSLDIGSPPFGSLTTPPMWRRYRLPARGKRKTPRRPARRPDRQPFLFWRFSTKSSTTAGSASVDVSPSAL